MSYKVPCHGNAVATAVLLSLKYAKGLGPATQLRSWYNIVRSARLQQCSRTSGGIVFEIHQQLRLAKRLNFWHEIVPSAMIRQCSSTSGVTA